MRKLLLTCLAMATVTLACDKKTPTGPSGIYVSPSSTTTTSSIPLVTTAAFIASPTAPKLNQPVAFNAVQSAAPAGNAINAYKWDLGDGSTADGVTVGHSYSVEGTYNVTLTVTDNAGKTATVSHPVTVGGTLSTTTSTVLPSTLLVRYVSTQVAASVPSDMTLNFRLLGNSQSAPFRTRLAMLKPNADAATYDVQGVFSTVSGVTGTVHGSFVGTIAPDLVGNFGGSLIGNTPPSGNTAGCFAERLFEGPTTDIIQWTGGATPRNTCGSGDTNSPLNFAVTLVKTDAPPPNTPTTSTTSSSTTTTSIAPATVSGTITDARTGLPVSGATITFAGAPAAASSATGAFTINGLAPGVRGVTVTAPDYTSRTDTITLASGPNTYSPALVPITGNITATLTWGEQPADLDVHLVLPDNTEIYFENLAGPSASLDRDDRDGFGPETITVFPVRGAFVAGTYQLFVFNYTAFGVEGNGNPGFLVSAPSPLITLSQGGVQIGQFAANAASGNPAAPQWSVINFTLAASPSGRIAVTQVQQFISNDARSARARSPKR